jgi:hypothetical protein
VIDALVEIPDLDDLASTQQIADILQIPKGTLLRLRFEEPRLPYIRIFNTILFSKTQVAVWLFEYQKVNLRKYDLQRETAKKSIAATNKRKGR